MPVITAHQDATTQAVDVGGTTFAYRDLGPRTGTPVVFLNHLAAVLDNWDPRVVDGIAAHRRVITFDNRGVGASQGRTPSSIAEMAKDAVAFIRALGFDQVDLLGFSMGGFVAQVIAEEQPDLVRKIILAGTGPAGGEGIDKVTLLTYLDVARGAVTFRDAKYYLFFTETANGRSAGASVPEEAEGAHARTATRRSPSRRSGHTSRPSTAGPSSSRQICRASSRRCSSRTATTTGWCPATTRPTSPVDCRTPSSRSTPTPATGASSSTTQTSSRKRWTSSMPDTHRPERTATMRAFVVDKYGKDGPRAADVPEPIVGRRDVLVRVSAASINPLDRMTRDGEFKRLIKYKPPFVLGHDMAGVVTEVGADVRDFKVGDEVYARPRDLRIGTFAEFIAIDQDDVAPKPDSLTLQEAAAVPLVALAAWQILVDRAHLQPGQKVLVHAGAGGLGSTVIQLAKHLGATVATTTGTATADLVRNLGADVVVDYTTAGLLPGAVRLRPRHRLPRGPEPGEVPHRAEARRPRRRRSRTTRRRVRQAARRAVDPGCRHDPAQPQGPQAGEGTRRALRVLLHAGQRLPAARARCPV